MSRRTSFSTGRSLQAQARALEAVLTPIARMIDYAMGWGVDDLKQQHETRRIQLIETRIMREVHREQREREVHERKISQLENDLAKKSLEIDRLRKQMGLDAPSFDPDNY